VVVQSRGSTHWINHLPLQSSLIRNIQFSLYATSHTWPSPGPVWHTRIWNIICMLTTSCLVALQRRKLLPTTNRQDPLWTEPILTWGLGPPIVKPSPPRTRVMISQPVGLVLGHLHRHPDICTHNVTINCLITCDKRRCATWFFLSLWPTGLSNIINSQIENISTDTVEKEARLGWTTWHFPRGFL